MNEWPKNSRHYFFRDSKNPYARIQILALAREVLSRDEHTRLYNQIHLYSYACLQEDCAEESPRSFALEVQRYIKNELQHLVGYTPKRPSFYLSDAIARLPRGAREAIKFSGDYLDQLIKHFYPSDSLETKNVKDKSLGTNLNNPIIASKIPLKLLKKLKKFNKILYVPAKHKFEFKNREHLFTPQEAITATVIMHALGKEIIFLSPSAEAYAFQKDKTYYDTRRDDKA